jgi:hypothetical protein
MIKEHNSGFKKATPVKEAMDVWLPNVNRNIPCRNGFVYAMVGSGGCGKSSTLLNMLKSSEYYRNKFENIYLFVPLTSFLSVEKHPLADHEKVYHELDCGVLEEIEEDLLRIKTECLDLGTELEHTLIILDDTAPYLKEKPIQKTLSKLITKTRHLGASWIFTLQALKYMPAQIRRQLTNISIWKPKSHNEWGNIAEEYFGIEKDKRQAIYDYCFTEPYQHLDIDLSSGRLYKNFNQLDIE